MYIVANKELKEKRIGNIIEAFNKLGITGFYSTRMHSVKFEKTQNQ